MQRFLFCLEYHIFLPASIRRMRKVQKTFFSSPSGNIAALAVAAGNADAIMANNEGLVKCSWEFEVDAAYEANVIMMHKGDVALCAAVNEALAEAYANGYYGPWYDEAKIAAGLETARRPRPRRAAPRPCIRGGR